MSKPSDQDAIILVSYPTDRHLQAVYEALTAVGANSIVFNTSRYPSLQNTLSVLFNGGETEIAWCSESHEHLLPQDNIRSVYYRRFLRDSDNYTVAGLSDYPFWEGKDFLRSVSLITPTIYWMSRLESIWLSSFKPYQLQVAKSLGFTIPETYIGNDPVVASSFSKQFSQIALKALSNHVVYDDKVGKRYLLLTTALSPQVLEAHMGQTSNAPCILQRFIEKSYDLRVTVVEDQVFAVKILSDKANPKAWEDFRADYDGLQYEPYQLSTSLESACRQLLKALNLNFGCIDLVRCRDTGSYYFLEINPNGQWFWLEEALNLGIPSAIAQCLIRGQGV